MDAHALGEVSVRSVTALRAIATKCRFWSSNVMELGAAKDLRIMAHDLEKKSEECHDIECPVDTGAPQSLSSNTTKPAP